jgi:hypothetical protein
VSNVRLIDAARTVRFRSDTEAGRVHETRIADMRPSALPAGRRLLQELGFLAVTRPPGEVIMPTKKPRGRALTRAQTAANRRMARRRVRIEHVNSRVKRWRMVHDVRRRCTQGIRDLLRDVCGARHNFRVRLTPWQVMV